MVNYLGFTNFESECFYMYYFKVFKFSLFLNFNETQLTCPAHCSQYKPTKERNKFNSVRTFARVNPCSISNFYFFFHLCLYWSSFWQNFPERRGSRFTVTVLFHVNWVRVLKFYYEKFNTISNRIHVNTCSRPLVHWKRGCFIYDAHINLEISLIHFIESQQRHS